jgi:hypothetical protein
MLSDSNDMSAETMASATKPWQKHAVHLPFEVLSTIIFFVQLQKAPQNDLHSCCLVSRSWYFAAVAPLYQSPVLNGWNSPFFVRTICAFEDGRRFKSPLLEHIRTLDMSPVPYDEPESVTETLLSRVAGGLEVFVAPGTNFS